MPIQIHTQVDRTAQRDWRSAIGNGMRGRCPRCGEGLLFKGFLKPVEACSACSEPMHHQRADDLPPYLVITIVGHIVVGGILMAEKYADWPMGLHIAIWPALTVILSLLLMQPAKGAVIGLQWAMRMHGFSGTPDRPERQPLPPFGPSLMNDHAVTLTQAERIRVATNIRPRMPRR